MVKSSCDRQPASRARALGSPTPARTTTCSYRDPTGSHGDHGAGRILATVLLKVPTLYLRVGSQGWGSLELFSGENIVVLTRRWV